MEEKLPRNLGMELMRATEAAALSAGQWMGLGKAIEADHHAMNAMVEVLNGLAVNGRIISTEQKRADREPAIIEKFYQPSADGPKVDIIIDAIDGRFQLANGYPGAISAAAIATRGSVWTPPKVAYMEKIVVGEDAAPYLVDECMDAPPAWTLSLIARAKGVKVSNLTVFVLDRPRHVDLIAEIRAAGAHVILRPDGDINGGLMACIAESNIDVLMGIGGVTEGLLTACAVKTLGGTIFGRLVPMDDAEKEAAKNAGISNGSILRTEDMIHSDQVFFSTTGITNGPLLKGVTYSGVKANTNSMIMRSETRTRRVIQAEHLLPVKPVEQDN